MINYEKVKVETWILHSRRYILSWFVNQFLKKKSRHLETANRIILFRSYLYMTYMLRQPNPLEANTENTYESTINLRCQKKIKRGNKQQTLGKFYEKFYNHNRDLSKEGSCIYFLNFIFQSQHRIKKIPTQLTNILNS